MQARGLLQEACTSQGMVGTSMSVTLEIREVVVVRFSTRVPPSIQVNNS